MCRKQNVLVLFQPQAFQNVALLNLIQIHVQHLCHGRACLVSTLLGQTSIRQIFPSELRIAHVHVGDHVHNAAISLLWQTLILATVTCLHVKQRDVQPLCADGRQAGVGIAQHQITLRLQFGQKFKATPQNISAGHAQIFANHRNQNVRAKFSESIFQLKIFPENGGKVSVPILIIIDHTAVKVFPAAFDNCGQPNDLRPSAAADHNLGAAIVLKLCSI